LWEGKGCEPPLTNPQPPCQNQSKYIVTKPPNQAETTRRNDKTRENRVLTCLEEITRRRMMIVKKQKLGIAGVAERGSLRV
jgi:hypothetical protein